MKTKVISILLLSTTLFGNKLPLFFSGNDILSQRELYSAVGLYKPYFYEFYKDRPAVEPKTIPLLIERIKSYYKTKGFFHTQVTSLETKKSLTILIVENKPIIIENIALDTNIDISGVIPFSKGDIFESEKFTQSKKDIETLYTRKGYCNAFLNAKSWVDIDLNYVYITYEARSKELCRFGRIYITPSAKIDKDVIASLLEVEENTPYSSDKVSQSYSNLYRYDAISKAIIKTQKENSNTLDVYVSVAENEKPIRFKAGIGASSDEGAMVLLGVKHNNFLGNLKTLGVETRMTQIKQSIKSNFDLPLANKITIGAEAGFENEEFIDFKQNRVYGNLYIKQRYTPVSFRESIVLDSATTYESQDLANFNNGTLLILSPKLEFWYDTRDKILNPSRGYFLSADIMGSVLSEVSDASYYKFNLSAGYIFPLKSSIIAVKGSFGTVNTYQGDVPSSYKYFSGGIQSNRAYGYRKLYLKDIYGNPIESNSITESTLEYRFPIYGEIKGVVFNDTTYLSRYNIPNYTNGYYSGGIGLRYITPVGPIAFDAGCDISRPTEQYAFHFHIGETF